MSTQIYGSQFPDADVETEILYNICTKPENHAFAWGEGGGLTQVFSQRGVNGNVFCECNNRVYH